MNLSKYFKGYNSLNIEQKADILFKFIKQNKKMLGHYGLDYIVSFLFDCYHYEEETP